METTRVHIKGEYRIDYLHFNRGLSETIVLLHGFGENAERIYRSVGPYLPSDKQLIIPNGLFPLAFRGQKRLHPVFAWYFYDKERDEYHIPYNIPARVVGNLLEEIGIRGEVQFIGYSQGGYLAPFCGQQYKQTKQVLCVNASLRIEQLDAIPYFPIHCLNGEEDPIVDSVLARKRFEFFRKQGLTGSFQSLPHCQHDLNERLGSQIGKILQL